MSLVTFRGATADDLPAICELGQVVNAIHHAAWPAFFAEPSDAARDDPHWRAILEGRQSTIVVATEDERLIGFVTGAWNDETNPLVTPIRIARVHTLCVDPRHRGRGLGRALMAEAERWARDVGAFEIRLNVWSFNEDARAVYDALGYEERSLTLGKRLAADP